MTHFRVYVFAYVLAAMDCYPSLSGILAAGTNGGNVLMWQWVGSNMGESQMGGTDKWEFKTFTSVGTRVDQVKVRALCTLLCFGEGEQLKAP